jgi:hypothetical protein
MLHALGSYCPNPRLHPAELLGGVRLQLTAAPPVPALSGANQDGGQCRHTSPLLAARYVGAWVLVGVAASRSVRLKERDHPMLM